MSTPFEFFRRHQKVALAAVTGAAVLSFVVFDTSGSGQLSPFGLAALVVGCFAIVGWIWGAGEGKSSENAIFGAVLGLALSLVFMFLGRPPAAISATSGNISTDELQELGRERGIANRMVNLVYYGGNPNAGFMAQFQLPQFMFGFGSQDQTSDVLISELLSREANMLGIQITDEAVMEFLKEVAGKDADGDDQLTKKVYNEAIKNTIGNFQGTSEDTVIDAVRHEMRARQAAKILLGGNRMTPVDVWDIHRKLNTRQTAQFVALPVQDFVDKSVQPTDAELAELFNTYKGNFPNYLPDGKPEEGRPGLYLQRRVRLAYLEPAYEEMEKLAGEVTEEEIQKRYEERYQREMPEAGPHGELQMPDFPALPNVPEATEGTPAPTTEPPAAETPAAPVGDKPAEEKPAESAAPAAEPKPEAAAPEVKPAEPAAPAAEPAPGTEATPEAPPAKPEGSSFRTRLSRLQPVVLIQGEPAAAVEKPAAAAPAAEAPAAPAAEAPAVEAPAVEAPAAAAPAVEAPAAPAAEGETPAAPAAEEKPSDAAPAADPAAPAAEKPADAAPLSVPPVTGGDVDGDPTPPSTGVRPLDEVLRQQIRDELLAEKTRPLVEAKTNAARDFMNDLHLGVAEYLDHQRSTDNKKPELSKEALTPEEATTQLKDYAQKNGLVYAETPLLTLADLLKSEDHPVGGALVGRQGRVIDMVNQSQPNDLYSAMTAFDIDGQASYAYWKIEDVGAHEPKSLDEVGMKETATEAWRSLKARALAEKRAQEIAEVITKSDKPLAEALAEQTVTGQKDTSVFVTLKSTGEFSWLQRSTAPRQFGGDNSPRLGAIQGVDGAGETFMAKVFNDLQPGGTAVVPNFDRSVFYVMHIDKRSPGDEVEVEVMRKQFLESEGDLSQYAMNQSRSRDGSFADRLFVKHGVKMPQMDKSTEN